MTDLELRITSAVETVVQVGRVVVARPPDTVAGVPSVVPGRGAEIAVAPRPDGLTCAVPRAVLATLPRDPDTPLPRVPHARHASPPLRTREWDTTAGVATVDPAVLDAVLSRVDARLRTPAPDLDPVASALATLAAAEATGDRTALCRATLALADALAASPDPDRARRAYDTVLAVSDGEDDIQAAALRGRGLLAARRDRPAAALADLRAAVALQQTAGAATAAGTWVAIGETEWAAGHPCPAVSAFRTALATLAEQGDRVAATWMALARGRVQSGPLPALPLPDTLAGRAVGALAELDPTAPPPALVLALAAADT